MNGYKKVLARRIEFNGTTYTGLVTAEARKYDNGRWCITIGQFREETHTTVFHNGTLIINCADGYDDADGAVEEPEFKLV
ncbi:MAG: hypothetical protein OSJ37_02645 [Muribaculaceae bacterium]|jgi:hypothetical protein|nr:hypothetical protein [Muribaculaceae bacterium]